MSRATATALTLLVLVGGAMPVAAADEATPTTVAAGAFVPGEVVVGWRRPAAGGEVARARGLAVVRELGAPGRGAAAVLSTEGRAVDTVIGELRADPAVAYAEPNYLFGLPEAESDPTGGEAGGRVSGELAGVPVNDPLTAGQYSLDRMDVREAWSRSTGGSGLVAVLDTGVQSGHPDLKGRVVRGWDFVNDDAGAADDNGHGTWVAGIIAAKAKDGYGIAGITWSDRILPVKIMSASGTGSTSDLAAGIVWAADQGADVINMSVGGFPYSQAVFDAVAHAHGAGAVLVGAAGNNNRRENFYPASYDMVISVSATQPEDEFSHWSSYGPKVDVSAPGSSVLTTNCTASACPKRSWGSHTYISGTSFATPNVAGVVALIRARYPDLTPTQVASRLRRTSDDLGYPGRDDRYGVGRVNAARALGADVAGAGRSAGDALEWNNAFSSADPIPRGGATTASIHPAGDEDWFSVHVPRAGRLEVRVTGIADTRAYPWNRSSLPVDPVVELYNRFGTLIARVDNEWEAGVEVARHSVGKGTRVYVRVTNYYANGNRSLYAVTPTFVDDVAPTAAVHTPPAGAIEVSQWVTATATFNEAVRNVTASTVRLRDLETMLTVGASVSYDARTREVRLTPSRRLLGTHGYRLELTSGITDTAGNPLPLTRVRFTTSAYAFKDVQGTPYAAQIQWLAARRLVTGCGSEMFCPTRDLNRVSAAVWLARSLALSPTTTDAFDDDDGTRHEDAINRVAAAGLMTGCGPRTFCPTADVPRSTMATIAARAFALPATTQDFYTDDEGRPYEDAVNRVTAAGLMSGCDTQSFCPGKSVKRQVMAVLLHAALTD